MFNKVTAVNSECVDQGQTHILTQNQRTLTVKKRSRGGMFYALGAGSHVAN